ncbi:MAG: S-adenosylmethionine:tRNA ribosyltransferase-isomerase [Chloroflexi bacterium]|nr:S-adenosylmethionine:tRNA ribosyltransferase-isomerase [Chloroflexota bacterium]
MITELNFTLPPELEAPAPAEARGLTRDGVRLMVSHYRDDTIHHTRFYDLARFLQAGDLLVINTSGTLNAALPATRADGTAMKLHLSTRLPGNLWTVEVRQITGETTRPFFDAAANETYTLPDGATATLLMPYNDSKRLWIASLNLGELWGTGGNSEELVAYLNRYGTPIRYYYVAEPWPVEYYQTVYANEPGSAEMPSAGRAFTPELITQLVAKGVQIAPLILHTGVASLEEHEKPYEEYYRVSAETARLVNAARTAGRRIIAVGTTVVRALETVTDENGYTYGGMGYTNLVITPERGVRAVNGLLTGLHEPCATHLMMLEAVCGREHLHHTYAAALQERYLWHEFGDLHLILP